MRSLVRSLALLWVSCLAGPLFAGIAATTPIEELVVDFGEAGLWARFNDGDWVSLSTLDPDMAATGDLDGSGHEELIVDFGAAGLWVLYDGVTWIQLHTLDAEFIAAGDLDGTASEELVVDFGEFGIWVWTDNQSWSMLHPASPDEFVLGDIDFGPNDVLVVDFGSAYGLWLYGSSSGWIQLTSLSPEGITILESTPVSAPAPPTETVEHAPFPGTAAFPNGDTGCNDCGVIADFGSAGVWRAFPTKPVSWTQLHPLDAQGFGTGDLDGDGLIDLIISFTGGNGTWVLSAIHGFSPLHPLTVEVQDAARIDGGSLDEAVFGFGSDIGTWVLRNALTYYFLHALTPDGIVSGDLDGELVPAPGVTLSKTSNPRGVIGTEGNAEFTVGVSNTGPETFTITAVGDTDFDLSAECPQFSGAVLGPLGLLECTFTEFIEGTPQTPHINTAIVEVTGNTTGRTSAASDSTSVTFAESVVPVFDPEQCSSVPSVSMVAGPSNGAFFAIDVMVDQIDDLFGLAFHVLYDPTSATFLGASSDESIFQAPGADTVILGVEASPGEVSAVATLLGRGFCDITGLACDEDTDCGVGTCLAGLDNATGFVMRLQFQAIAVVTSGDPITFDLGHREVTECTAPTIPCTDIQAEVSWCGGTLYATP